MDSKTRAKLRSIANTLQTEVLVGQSGITDNVLEQIKMNLTAHEIVKIGLLNNSDLKAKELINELAESLGAEPIQAIGNKMVIYKYSPKCKNHIL
ncbi:MAG: YhbY family RNA-binding protein [bacterium]|nr:YhbY family RNA-binding protein [bacterium]